MESSKRIKLSLSKKLKEYANKMGRDHLGGDDIPGNKKKGGLRDFDGYDNVQYNRDMPMDEDSPESAHPQGSKKLSGRTTVMDMLDVISHKEFGPDYHKLSTKQKKEVHKMAIKGKLIKQSPFKESVNERADYKYLTQVILDAKPKYDVYYNSSHNVVNIGGVGYDKGDLVKNFNQKSGSSSKIKNNFYHAHQDPQKTKREVEKLSKGKIKVKVGKGGFLSYSLKESIGEELSEPTLFNEFLLEGGLPQNWMAGRVSDYHTKLRGKRKDYDDTNFAKMNTGQPDIEDEELDPDNEVVNEKFDNTEHLSLLNKALRAIPGSKKQKDIIKQLNVVRKSGGMKPLKEISIEEYGQRLDLSYILDDESVLDGTPEPKDAINKESAKKKTEKNYKDWKRTNEKVDNYYLKNAKFRLKKVYKYLDIEYKTTRRGLKYVQINYIPVSRPQSQNPEFVNVGYENEKDLQIIGKALKLKLKEGIEEETKRDYKDEYKKFQSSTKSKKYRAELNKYNRDKGTYGNGDGKDASHKGGKIVGFESASKNRGRKEKSRLKKK